MTISLAILGSSGKMGQAVRASAAKDPQWKIVASPGRTEESFQSAVALCDVVIDFSSPDATGKLLAAALRSGKPVVLGTTGHTPEQKALIEAASKKIPLLYSPNFSLGVALCLETAERLGKALFDHCTIDIFESHHIHKKDSPSGTALALAAAIGRGKVCIEKPASEPRGKDEIVIHSTRTQEAVGEHTLVFESAYERIELKHTAFSREAFASGALLAAKFLLNQPPGLYSNDGFCPRF